VLDSAKVFELGGEQCVLSVVHDITDRKRAEGVMQARLRLADFASEHSLQELLQSTLDEAEILTGSSIGFYHFLDDDQRTLTLQAWSTNTLEHMCTAEGAGKHYPLDEAGVWVDCVRERHPVIHNDYPALPNRKGMPEGHAPVARELVVPVFRADKVVAILGVGNKPTGYDEEDVRTIESLAEVAWEVAERKRAQEALRASEEEHRALLQKIATSVIVHDASGRIITVNAAAMAALSSSERDLLGKTPHETGWRFFREDGTAMPTEEFPVDRVLASRESLDGLVVGLGAPGGPPGPETWILANAEPAFDAQGELAQVIATFVDVTERRHVEMALQESESKYREIFDSVSDALTVFDVTEDGRFRFAGVNASAERSLGISAAEVLGRYYGEATDPEEAEHTLAAFREAIARSSSVEYERRYVRDGEDRYFDTILLPVADESGGARRLIVLQRDITEHRRMEQDLSARERESRTLLASIPDFIVRYDRDLRRTYVNAAWEAAAGVTAGEVVDAPFERTLNAHTWYADRIKRVFESGLPDDIEFAWTNARDETLQLQYALIPERDESDDVVSVLAVGHDVTERKQAEELRIAKQTAEKANVAKSAFLASMSHEIRTPMNAILGFSQLMQHDKGLTERQRQQLDIINTSGEHLLSLINDILEMSKIEAGRVVLNSSAFDLHELIGEMKSLFGLRARSKALDLRIEWTENVPRYVVTDEGKLRQVFVNLLGNALKFTDTGGVVLEVDARRDAQERLRLTVEVKDTGRGIPRQDVDRVFGYFERSARQGAEAGTGLGLAISREFVRVMGGDITVESTVGVGSVFRFDVLIEPVEAAAVPSKPSQREVIGLCPGQPEYRVLVVDDIPESRELLVELLGPVGFDMRAAANGKEAVETFGSWHPHLILMDMRMPVMDGYEATRRIRAMEGGSDVGIIAVTASAFAEMRKGVFDAGVDEFLVKPFAESELFEMIGKVIGVRFVYEDAPSAAADVPSQSLDTSALAELPDDLTVRLRHMVNAADFDAVLGVVDEIEHEHAQAAALLRALAESFDADGILNALRVPTALSGRDTP
jgi:PAS domain S-box-containing protein